MNVLHKLNVAIFASGSGGNAESLIAFSFQEESLYNVVLILSNKEFPGVRKIAEMSGIPFQYVQNPDDGIILAEMLQKCQVDIIALGGYLRLLPSAIVDRFRGRILNIHPSLLPEYGGKGMYGNHVHMAVLNDKKPYTGVTIHLVDEEYDTGSALVQAKIDISDCMAPEEIARKVKEVEHQVYPMVLNQLCKTISA